MAQARLLSLDYTPRALAELDGVLGQIGEQSPIGAMRVRRRIKAIIIMLARHPHAGQKTSIPGLRRIVVTPYPYVVFYQPRERSVVIIAIRHAARDPDTMPGE